MSVTATIDLQIEIDEGMGMVGLIEVLCSYGWGFNYDGMVFYLPPGDKDSFSWVRGLVSDEELIKILKQKERNSESIGVTMIWASSGVGGEFNLFPDGLMSVNLSVNRKITDQGFTDVNWYLEKVVYPIRHASVRIESIEFTECI